MAVFQKIIQRFALNPEKKNYLPHWFKYRFKYWLIVWHDISSEEKLQFWTAPVGLRDDGAKDTHARKEQKH
jgi:hypothetical protein